MACAGRDYNIGFSTGTHMDSLYPPSTSASEAHSTVLRANCGCCLARFWHAHRTSVLRGYSRVLALRALILTPSQ
jgi:hypothetical protein